MEKAPWYRRPGFWIRAAVASLALAGSAMMGCTPKSPSGSETLKAMADTKRKSFDMSMADRNLLPVRVINGVPANESLLGRTIKYTGINSVDIIPDETCTEFLPERENLSETNMVVDEFSDFYYAMTEEDVSTGEALEMPISGVNIGVSSRQAISKKSIVAVNITLDSVIGYTSNDLAEFKRCCELSRGKCGSTVLTQLYTLKFEGSAADMNSTEIEAKVDAALVDQHLSGPKAAVEFVLGMEDEKIVKLNESMITHAAFDTVNNNAADLSKAKVKSDRTAPLICKEESEISLTIEDIDDHEALAYEITPPPDVTVKEKHKQMLKCQDKEKCPTTIRIPVTVDKCPKNGYGVMEWRVNLKYGLNRPNNGGFNTLQNESRSAYVAVTTPDFEAPRISGDFNLETITIETLRSAPVSKTLNAKIAWPEGILEKEIYVLPMQQNGVQTEYWKTDQTNESFNLKVTVQPEIVCTDYKLQPHLKIPVRTVVLGKTSKNSPRMGWELPQFEIYGDIKCPPKPPEQPLPQTPITPIEPSETTPTP